MTPTVDQLNTAFREFCEERDRPGTHPELSAWLDACGCPWGAIEERFDLRIIDGDGDTTAYQATDGTILRFDYDQDAFIKE